MFVCVYVYLYLERYLPPCLTALYRLAGCRDILLHPGNECNLLSKVPTTVPLLYRRERMSFVCVSGDVCGCVGIGRDVCMLML